MKHLLIIFSLLRPKIYKERQIRIINIVNKKYNKDISNLWLKFNYYDRRNIEFHLRASLY